MLMRERVRSKEGRGHVNLSQEMGEPIKEEEMYEFGFAKIVGLNFFVKLIIFFS